MDRGPPPPEAQPTLSRRRVKEKDTVIGLKEKYGHVLHRIERSLTEFFCNI